jgi:hypothetical protein
MQELFCAVPFSAHISSTPAPGLAAGLTQCRPFGPWSLDIHYWDRRRLAGLP